jgi:insulysin
MIAFFDHYISPSSPARSKLVVYLHAKGLSPVADAESTPAATAAVELEDDALSAKPVAAESSSVVETAKTNFNEGLNIVKEKIEEETKPLSLAPLGNGANNEKPDVYIITNVREYRARMAVSAGPLPVKDLSEFEDLDAKL